MTHKFDFGCIEKKKFLFCSVSNLFPTNVEYSDFASRISSRIRIFVNCIAQFHPPDEADRGKQFRLENNFVAQSFCETFRITDDTFLRVSLFLIFLTQ